MSKRTWNPSTAGNWEVFDQRHAWTFRTVKTERRAAFWVWLYNKLGYRDIWGNRLRFDSYPEGEGWL